MKTQEANDEMRAFLSLHFSHFCRSPTDSASLLRHIFVRQSDAESVSHARHGRAPMKSEDLNVTLPLDLASDPRDVAKCQMQPVLRTMVREGEAIPEPTMGQRRVRAIWSYGGKA